MEITKKQEQLFLYLTEFGTESTILMVLARFSKGGEAFQDALKNLAIKVLNGIEEPVSEDGKDMIRKTYEAFEEVWDEKVGPDKPAQDVKNEPTGQTRTETKEMFRLLNYGISLSGNWESISNMYASGQYTEMRAEMQRIARTVQNQPEFGHNAPAMSKWEIMLLWAMNEYDAVKDNGWGIQRG